MSDAERSEGLVLDPFAFIGSGIASRIEGLGGSTVGNDPVYAFHTAYVDVAPGHSEFHLQFEGLSAKQGTLMLRVHMLPKEEGAHAILSTSQRASFNRIVQQNGYLTVRFEAFRGVTYALYGMIQGDCDARAHGLRIALDRPAGSAEPPRIVIDPRSSSFGREAAAATAFMISLDRPQLAHPVCQVATVPQLTERAARDWLAKPELEQLAEDARRWSAAYVLQTLTLFGMLAKGAKGIGFGHDAHAIAAVAAAGGTEIALVQPADTATQAPPPGVTIIPEAPNDLSVDVVNYDFAWSVGTASKLGSIANGVSFIREIIERLRPGGIAVHTMAYNLSSAEDTIERGETVLFRRADLERIALTMISLGHEAAQIRIDTRNPILTIYPGATRGDPVAGYCGIMIRKATTAL